MKVFILIILFLLSLTNIGNSKTILGQAKIICTAGIAPAYAGAGARAGACPRGGAVRGVRVHGFRRTSDPRGSALVCRGGVGSRAASAVADAVR